MYINFITYITCKYQITHSFLTDLFNLFSLQTASFFETSLASLVNILVCLPIFTNYKAAGQSFYLFKIGIASFSYPFTFTFW